MGDEVLRELKPRFSRLYAKTGRPSIAPEKLLLALLLQVLYSVRRDRMLMEQLDYSLLAALSAQRKAVSRSLISPHLVPVETASATMGRSQEGHACKTARNSPGCR